MGIHTSRQHRLEESLRQSCSPEVPRAVLEKFSGLVRLSGNDDERAAVDYLVRRLEEFGVRYELRTPTLFVSWPVSATLRALGDAPLEVRAKTPSMSASTSAREVEGELVYLPTGYAGDVTDIFDVGEIADVDVRGKVVITEGMPMPPKVGELTARGVMAAVFVAPGAYIHEGICTTIWGSPDLDSMDRQPSIPVLAVNQPEGRALIGRAGNGDCRVTFSTELETGWRPIPVLVAEVPGRSLPEEFVLVHGHLDSWHYGVGDNAVGDAALLELARVFQQHSDHLERSVRIAWWSGHSHGRYAGSTWYADTQAIDLAENCVAHVNCDSPGCREATVYTDVMWTEECGPLASAAVRDVTNLEAEWVRPLRAGDYSFSNLGISGFFMLSSTMPEELREEKGYYTVGGCGGNIQWHTEDDTLEVADEGNLLRDIRLYATAIARAANAPVPPFDFRLTLEQFERALSRYQALAGNRFDMGAAGSEITALRAELDRFYSEAEGWLELGITHPKARRAAAAQRKLARILIPVNYAREGRFRQDPAVNVPALPDLALVSRLAVATPGSHEEYAARISLQRGLNRLVWALRRAREVVVGTGVVED